MRFRQFLLQEPFVNFFWIIVSVQVQIEWHLLGELNLFFEKSFGIVVIVDWLLRFQNIVEEARQRVIPIGLEERKASRGELFLTLSVELVRIESSDCQVMRLGHCHVLVIHFLILMVKNKDVSMITRSFWWKRLKIWNDQLASRHVAVWNVAAKLKSLYILVIFIN